MSLEKRLLVLRRDGEDLQLPMAKYLTVKAPKDIPSAQYVMFRVSRFEESNSEIWLKYESGICTVRDFEISAETNSELLLSYNIKKINISPRYSDYTSSKSFNSDIDLNKRLNAVKPSWQESDQPSNSSDSPKQNSIVQTIQLPIKDIHFEDGKVTFTTYVNQTFKSKKFEIHNPFLKKEFDAIKNYFAKAFKSKKITIQINLDFFGTNITNQSASSEQIEQINSSLLEEIEDYIVEDEFFSNDEEIIILKDKLEKVSNTLGNEEIKDPDWLLNKLITTDKTKHYNQLRFLSSRHISHSINLMLTGRPLSFIFLIQNDHSFYLVWETYKTEEATYIWKLTSKDISEVNKEIEKLLEVIKGLRKGKKLSYIGMKPDNFKRIEHDYSGEDIGFKKWKDQLDKLT